MDFRATDVTCPSRSSDESGLDGFEVSDHVVDTAFSDQLQRRLATKALECLIEPLDCLGPITGDRFGKGDDTIHFRCHSAFPNAYRAIALNERRIR